MTSQSVALRHLSAIFLLTAFAGAAGAQQAERQLARNILDDQKAIWTSPFHLDKEDAEWWAGFSAVTAALIVTDRRTVHTFENSPGQVRYGNDVSRLGASYTLIGEAGGLYLVGLLAKDQTARETGLLGAEALADSLIVMEVLKTTVGRNRPNAPSEPGSFFERGASFPSGHTIASFALASVIAHKYGDHKWVPFVAYGLATAVGAARFTGQQHYASDIVVGGAMGYFIGRYVVRSSSSGHHRHL